MKFRMINIGLKRQKADPLCLGSRDERRFTKKKHEGNFWVINFYIPIDVVTKIYTYLKTHRTVHQKNPHSI